MQLTMSLFKETNEGIVRRTQEERERIIQENLRKMNEGQLSLLKGDRYGKENRPKNS